MSYNLLNYPGSDTTTRNPYFRTIIQNTLPDVLVVQEITSQAGVNGFLNNVLNSISSGYSAGTFIDGPDTDNAIFFKSSIFSFVSNTPIPTALRDINEFKLVHNSTGDTIRIYSVHLKASSGSTNEQLRLAEVTLLRNITDALPLNKEYIVCGDFNIYGSTEPAYQKLLNQSTTGYFLDLFNLTGTWNNSAYAQYHTQSPRVRSFGGGATGGMDDRFDMILLSPAVFEFSGIAYIINSYTAYGNDGLHYNDSINRPPNNAVSQSIADAIHYASDHIPVFASFQFGNPLPVEIDLFTAKVIDDYILLNWQTATEINNYGFEVERNISDAWVKIGFVEGNGNSNSPKGYSFTDNKLVGGSKYQYRLKQIDSDGQFEYSDIVEIEVAPNEYVLYPNYPNPFNPSTKITYSIPERSIVSLKVFDLLGSEVVELVKGEIEAGTYDVSFNASNLPSGIYFYQLSSGEFLQTKKMILLK